MAVKKVQFKQNLALLLACVSLLVFGGLALFENGGITYSSLIASGIRVIPYVAVMYLLGWVIGCIVESSKMVKKANALGYTNSLLEEILKEEGLENLDDSDFADIDSIDAMTSVEEDSANVENENKE